MDAPVDDVCQATQGGGECHRVASSLAAWQPPRAPRSRRSGSRRPRDPLRLADRSPRARSGRRRTVARAENGPSSACLTATDVEAAAARQSATIDGRVLVRVGGAPSVRDWFDARGRKLGDRLRTSRHRPPRIAARERAEHADVMRPGVEADHEPHRHAHHERDHRRTVAAGEPMNLRGTGRAVPGCQREPSVVDVAARGNDHPEQETGGQTAEVGEVVHRHERDEAEDAG